MERMKSASQIFIQEREAQDIANEVIRDFHFKYPNLYPLFRVVVGDDDLLDSVFKYGTDRNRVKWLDAASKMAGLSINQKNLFSKRSYLRQTNPRFVFAVESDELVTALEDYGDVDDFLFDNGLVIAYDSNCLVPTLNFREYKFKGNPLNAIREIFRFDPLPVSLDSTLS